MATTITGRIHSTNHAGWIECRYAYTERAGTLKVTLTDYANYHLLNDAIIEFMDDHAGGRTVHAYRTGPAIRFDRQNEATYELELFPISYRPTPPPVGVWTHRVSTTTEHSQVVMWDRVGADAAQYRYGTREEFQARIQETRPIISGNDFVDKTPRTLLYGYTVGRSDFHVYLNDAAEIVLTVEKDIIEVQSNSGYVPSKRVYPEWLDIEFVGLLDRAGIPIPDTTYGTPATTLFHPTAIRARFD